ncbi:hypothetical protein [Clostridium sp. Ade.TY]|uniref:hypothetical protein n=1 Tax=Clostridium sp. Ade.TY TaxID=1391647 RepID=UPI00042497C1|nr:hypothetical protein [Clostridium sp. Ade.TY]
MYCRYPDGNEFFFKVDILNDELEEFVEVEFDYRNKECSKCQKNISCEKAMNNKELQDDFLRWINTDVEFADEITSNK